jgi:hypothetical protein
MFLEAPQPARPNLGSMLFLTAFFFFMSGNNQMPPQTIQIGPDGEFVPRVTELDMSREHLEEYKGFLNGTSGNWTEVSIDIELDLYRQLRLTLAVAADA